VSGTHSSHLPVEDLERWARQLSLEPGSVLQLVCGPAQLRMRAVLLLERFACGDAPWERKRNFSWRLLDLESGEPGELPESHLLAFYSRP
jgi:hypothetical protein